MPCVFGWLAHCERLSRLGLHVQTGTRMTTHERLAAVGPLLGGRVRSLTPINAQLPPTRGAAARAVNTLGACYPHLEVLLLRVDDNVAKEVSQCLLQAVPALALFCPALREVRVGELGGESAVQMQRQPGGGVAAIKFVGSCFDYGMRLYQQLICGACVAGSTFCDVCGRFVLTSGALATCGTALPVPMAQCFSGTLVPACCAPQ